MKYVKLLLVLGLIRIVNGQTPPGIVNVVTTVTITSTAGTAPANISCNFTGNASAAQITVNCVGAGATLNSTLPIPLPAPGTIGNFNLSGNIITWGFQPWSSAGNFCPTGSTSGTCWQVVANGTAKNGVF